MAQVDIHAPGVEVKKSACYFCHANCGVLAYVKDGEVIKIEGDPDYTNQGGLCCRGTSALKHVHHPARINHCLKRVNPSSPFDVIFTIMLRNLKLNLYVFSFN